MEKDYHDGLTDGAYVTLKSIDADAISGITDVDRPTLS